MTCVCPKVLDASGITPSRPIGSQLQIDMAIVRQAVAIAQR